MIHLRFDDEQVIPVATEEQWDRLGEWVEGFDRLEEFKSLVNEGGCDNLPALAEQISFAHANRPALDIETQRKALEVLRVVEQSKAAAVMAVQSRDDNLQLAKSLSIMATTMTGMMEMVKALASQVSETKSMASPIYQFQIPQGGIQMNMPPEAIKIAMEQQPITINNAMPAEFAAAIVDAIKSMPAQPAPVIKNEIKMPKPEKRKWPKIVRDPDTGLMSGLED